MSPFLIDAFKFSKLSERLEGETMIAEMERVAEVAQDKSGSITWVLQGGNHRLGYPQLTLQVSGAINLLCQRCLTPLSVKIDSESVLVLVKDEARADEVEAQLDDDAIDVIAVSEELNLRDLIEDETLLSLPFAPKHEICPDQTASADLAKNEKASPFAVLKNLK
ncbi:MAG TPA: YceD family protein [Herbaspirillum sp.]|jgi:uncharacterized protein|nr:YceD family protein [Herbaspirillum sp.]